MVEVKRYSFGELRSNCYVVYDPEENMSVLVDPGGESEKLESKLKEVGNLKYILLTHGHFDHILKAKKYRDITGAKIVIGENEKEFTYNNSLNLSEEYSGEKLEPFEADILVADGDELRLGWKNKIKIISTPGHTQGGVCYMIEDSIFSGDTLFRGSVGRTDLKTGNEAVLKFSIKKLYEIEREYVVYPGHGLFTILSKEKLKHTGLE